MSYNCPWIARIFGQNFPLNSWPKFNHPTAMTQPLTRHSTSGSLQADSEGLLSFCEVLFRQPEENAPACSAVRHNAIVAVQHWIIAHDLPVCARNIGGGLQVIIRRPRRPTNYGVRSGAG
jgi:hypothetical protein